MNKEEELIAPNEQAYLRAKEIIKADIETEDDMSNDDKSELRSIAHQLVEYSVVQLMNHGDVSNFFWGNTLLVIHRMMDFTLPAPAAVTITSSHGPVLLINPYTLISKTTKFKEIQSIIKHEGYHLLFNHLGVYQNIVKNSSHDLEIMNYATDTEINQYVTGLPDWTVSLNSTEKMIGKKLKAKEGSLYYFDEIKKALKNKQNNQDESGEGQGDGNGQGSGERQGDGNGQGSGESQGQGRQKTDDINRDGSDNGRHNSWSFNDVSESFAKELINEVFRNAKDKTRGFKGRGDLPGEISEALEKLNKPAQIKWSTKLRNMTSFIPYGKKLSKNRLNRRFPNALYKKGLIMGEGKNIWVFIDTSGSMSEKELQVSINECVNIAKQKGIKLYIANVDTQITEVYEVNKPSDFKWSAKGGGGTCMQPGFDYLKDNDVDPRSLVVYFTDGYIESHINNYDYKNVLWVLTDGDGNQLDESIFGERAKLRIEED